MHHLLEILILGIIQGITEWLPISSTGHLKLFEQFMGLQVPILFDVLLHFGTLMVVLVFFRREITRACLAVRRLDFESEYGKLVPLVIVGVIPTLLIGLVLGRVIEEAFQTSLPIAMALLLMGLILLSTTVSNEKTDDIGYATAIVVGIAQGIAIVPGISRSGITIAVALLLGTKRENAFRFSFLLSIPAILGALGFTLYTEFDELAASGLTGSEILAGVLVAMLVGYYALKLLWKIVSVRKFYLFAFYCWSVGVLLLLSAGML